MTERENVFCIPYRHNKDGKVVECQLTADRGKSGDVELWLHHPDEKLGPLGIYLSRQQQEELGIWLIRDHRSEDY
ncbi:MAG: hypothetical protein ACR2QH_15245 [Geminicoccaceae bacterium]